MIFLGNSFCCGGHYTTAVPVPNITKIEITKGFADELFLSKNPSLSTEESYKKWDYDTLLFALFQNNLFGGNVNFTVDTVSAIRIKRRECGTFEWKTLFEIDISKREDFDFERYDRLAKSNRNYEYALVPVIDKSEGIPSTNQIESKFGGIYLIEKDVMYHLYLNAKLNYQQNSSGTTVTTLGRKYPFYISNGQSNYTSGQLQGTFIDYNASESEYDIDGGVVYRSQVNAFLTNKRPKILKSENGEMWLVNIVDIIQEDSSAHWQMPIHTVQWVQTGDCDDIGDLYDNNFIDTDLDRR